MASVQPSYRAAGNILPARFVKISADDAVIAAGAGDFAVGVSGLSVRSAPLPESSQVNHAIAGDPITPFTFGETCFVEAGGVIAAGARVTSGAGGVAVTAGANVFFHGIARVAAASGELVKVFLVHGRTPAA